MSYKGTRMLTSGEYSISAGENGGLDVAVKGEDVYRGVKVYRCFPLSKPTEYISLRVGATKSEEKEIGVIRDLSELPPPMRELVDTELKKRYYIHTISRIHSIKEEFAYFYWDVETDKGRKRFSTPVWARHHVTECGEDGRVITDVDKNRYVIPSLSRLDHESRRVFSQCIYW